MNTTAPAAWFATQVRQEMAELDQLQAMLALEHRLGRTTAVVHDEFQLLLQERTRALRELDKSGTVDWARLDRLRKNAGPVKVAAFGLLEGLLLRAHPMYEPIAQAAECLLDGLIERTGVEHETLLSVGQSERFERVVGMIRLRFPDTAVWGLPILAHEVGHLVADTLHRPGDRNSRPVLNFIAVEAEQTASIEDADPAAIRPWLHELFADVYATYAVGLAYPLATLSLRARSDLFRDRTLTHPSWNRRMWTMIEALRALGEHAATLLAGQAYRHAADALVAPRWLAVTDGQPPGARDAQLARSQATGMVRLLEANAPDRLRHDPTVHLDGLIGDLVAARPVTASPVEAINAAWRWRIDNPEAGHWENNRISANVLSSASYWTW